MFEELSNPNQTSFRPFEQILRQYKAAYIFAFNPGASVPPTPEVFEKRLLEELKAFGINFPGTGVNATEIEELKATIDFYKGFYAFVLSLPLPANPQEEYEAWYKSTH